MNTITLRVFSSATAAIGLLGIVVILTTDRAIPPLLTILITVGTTIPLWILRDTFTAPKYIRMSLESGILKERQRIVLGLKIFTEEIRRTARRGPETTAVLQTLDSFQDIVLDVDPTPDETLCHPCSTGHCGELLLTGDPCDHFCHPQPSGVKINGREIRVPSGPLPPRTIVGKPVNVPQGESVAGKRPAPSSPDRPDVSCSWTPRGAQ